MTDEVDVLRKTLSAHRSMLMAALDSNVDLDIDRAFAAYAVARVRALQAALGYA